jgi:hypothetical protein
VSEKSGEPPDIAHIIALRLAAEVPHVHVVDQALAQRAEGRGGGNRNKLVHRSTPWLKEPKCSANVRLCSIHARRSLFTFASPAAPIREAVRASAH